VNSVIKFKKLNIEDAKLVLDWRTSQRVTSFMNSDLEYNLLNQIKWINDIQESKENYYWIIEINNTKVGLISLTNLDFVQKNAYWGYYIGDENFLGFGSLVPPYFYNFVFNELNLEVLHADVFYDNTIVIKMHLKFGYNFNPLKDKVIFKNNKPILLVAMNLFKSNWNSNRYKKFKSNLTL
jgi:UDP-4-amino-4,6-dideoxy-N-acetyl-beta-L-altrosamine N-acetyltransferase